MRIIKIMPYLDMKDGRMVKGVHFVDLKDACDPVENVAYYHWEGADKLAMLDIATVENRKTKLEWVKNASAVIDVPLTMGGGISILEDIEKVLPPAPTRSDENAAATFLTEMASVPPAVYINGKGDSISGKLDPIYLMSRQERGAHRECSRIYTAT